MHFFFNNLTFLQPNARADHVKLVLYYEALCGGCHQWITDEMYPTYQKLGKYMDVEFVPYGNAHVGLQYHIIQCLFIIYVCIIHFTV